MTLFLNISEISHGRGSLEARLPVKDVVAQSTDPSDTIRNALTQDIVATITSQMAGRSVVIDGKLTTTLTPECARCNDPVEYRFSTKFRRVFFHQDEIEKNNTPDDDDVDLHDGVRIDIFALCVEHFYLELPMIFHCSDDCEGLCDICGNKNIFDHECKNSVVVNVVDDARSPFTALQNLKRKFKNQLSQK